MTIEARVRSIIADQLGVSEEEIRPESNFIEDLGADSLELSIDYGDGRRI